MAETLILSRLSNYEKVRLEVCTREIAEILYRNVEAKDVEQLKTLEVPLLR